MLRRFRWLMLLLVLVPGAVLGWGTLTGGLNLDASDTKNLKWLIEKYGLDPKGLGAQFEARTGAHPVHQFIVDQALKVLAKDPALGTATEPAPLPLPDVAAINAWDGIERCEQGMRERGGESLTPLTDLAPPKGDGGGAGADAEITSGGGWNPSYNGRAHYWNPWLEDGDAPAMAGINYERLATLTLEGGDANKRAHHAAYLAHYVADPVSAKHADVVTLDPVTVEKLIGISKRWMTESWLGGPVDEIEQWIASPILTEAVDLIQDRARALSPRGQAWLDRVDRQVRLIGGTKLLQRGWWYASWVDIAESSFRSAVACYLHELDARPTVGDVKKPLDPFYSYFDPFYFNGPIFNPAFKSPDFKICVPLSEHLFWETNPAQDAVVNEVMQLPGELMILGVPDPKTAYLPWVKSADFGSFDAAKNAEAMKKAAADLVKRCSDLSHGDINRDSDFGPVFRDKLSLSVRCVATMLRAATTGLRGEGWARKTPDGTLRAQLVLDIKSDAPVTLLEARFATLDALGQAHTAPGWTVDLGKKALEPGKPLDVGATLEGVPDDLEVGDFVVDIRADFGTYPDLGRLRIPLGTREAKRVVNPDAGAKLVRTKGPIDVVVVFDTTGSMQSSIDSLRDNAIAAIQRLRSQTSDIRMAVVTFRDRAEKDDAPFFLTSGFSRNLETQFAFMRGLKADGGGDTPEDQLDGLSRAIALWEREPQDEDRVPAKVIVTITDAPAKVPDAAGNTFESIKARADAVDPAHIYPIIVGSDPSAAAHAKVLADTTGGRVLTVASGDAVAEALMTAVDTAVVEHGADEAPRRSGTAFLVGGIALVVLALGAIPVVIWGGRRRRASAKSPAVVHADEHVVWGAEADSAAVERVAGKPKRRVWAWVLVAVGVVGGMSLVVVGLARAPSTRAATVELAVATKGPLAPIARPSWRPDELAGDTFAIDEAGHVVQARGAGLATFGAWKAAYLVPPPVMNDRFPPSPVLAEYAAELSARPPSAGLKLPRLKLRLGEAEPAPTTPEAIPEAIAAQGFSALQRFIPAESWLVVGLEVAAARRSPALSRAVDALDEALGETTPLSTIGGREVVRSCEQVLYAGTTEGVDASEAFVFAGAATAGWVAIGERAVAAGASAVAGTPPWWSMPTGEAVMVDGAGFAAARRGSAGKLVAARAGAWLGPTSGLGAMVEKVRGAALFAALRVTPAIRAELERAIPGLGPMTIVGVAVSVADGLSVTVTGELPDADAATYALASLVRVRDGLPGSAGKVLLERVVGSTSGATLTLTLTLSEEELGSLVRDAGIER
jgi:hypothetical protein